jgi:hypothetical protein
VIGLMGDKKTFSSLPAARRDILTGFSKKIIGQLRSTIQMLDPILQMVPAAQFRCRGGKSQAPCF